MAKERVELLRGVRMPARRAEGGKVVEAGAVVTDAEELDAATLKAVAEKGYVSGMEPARVEEGEAASGGSKKSASKSKG